MKIKLLLTLLTFAIPFIGYAQIWEDNFDDGDISDWTTVDFDGDGNNWEADGFGIDGSGAISSASWIQAQGVLSPNNHIISPAIDLTGVTGSVALDWSAYPQDQAWPSEHYQVFISTEQFLDADDPGTPIFEETLTALGTDVWAERTISLNDFVGEVVYLTFVHNESSDWFRVNIDNVSVYQPNDADAGVSGILSPVNETDGCILSDAVTPTITIFNFGGSAISNFEVSYTVNGGTPVTEMVTASIDPATGLDFTFATPFDGSALGTYEIEYTTNLDGDNVTDNNSNSNVVTHSDAVFTVHVMTDVAGGIGWSLTDNATGAIVADHGGYAWDSEFSDDVCISSEGCYSFSWVHDEGSMQAGSYLELLVDGQTIFGDTNGNGLAESEIFTPAVGGGCAPLDASIGNISTVRYHVLNGSAVIEGTFTNLASNTITDLQMSYSVNGGAAVTEDFSGLNVTSGTAGTFAFATPHTLADFEPQNLEVSILTVNGEMENSDNNTTTGSLEAVSFIPAKKVIAEEGTGTWCGWCPRGEILLETMNEEYQDDFISIAVHNGDPMVVSEYDGQFGIIIGGGYPGIALDRVNGAADPGGILPAQLDAIRADINERLEIISPMTMEATAVLEDGVITVDLSSEFVANLEGDYRFNVVITEDGVTGTDGGYDQRNFYSGGGAGAMQGYENLADPVPASDMVYNHVARAILGGFDGQAGSIPAVNERGDVVTDQFTYNVPSGYNTANMHVIAMIMDNTTGGIVNSTSAPMLLDTDTDDLSILENQVKLFPNPTRGHSVIELNLEVGQNVNVSIANSIGQQVANRNYGEISGKTNLPILTDNFENGMYYINIQIGEELITKKLVLAK